MRQKQWSHGRRTRIVCLHTLSRLLRPTRCAIPQRCIDPSTSSPCVLLPRLPPSDTNLITAAIMGRTGYHRRRRKLALLAAQQPHGTSTVTVTVAGHTPAVRIAQQQNAVRALRMSLRQSA